ncbi:MAG: hypothetical protein PHR21_08005 [Oscillospiraceae bacterium]|nr:hypothetical protein [Oscillospiraceae bacterium]MDD4368181.1 hypothetical protein [Oscillospiraceae bacterium]
MSAILYSPPVVFGLFLLLFLLLLRLLDRYAVHGGTGGAHALDPYACGQRDFENYVNPDYTQFFRYAFVFTVMHVVALVIATASVSGLTVLPLIYVAASILSLAIIFRK